MRISWVMAVLLGLAACSSSKGTSRTSHDAGVEVGSRPDGSASGGAAGAGGTSGSGGATASGGIPKTGGTTSGGLTSTGGLSSTGGMAGGGSSNSGTGSFAGSTGVDASASDASPAADARADAWDGAVEANPDLRADTPLDASIDVPAQPDGQDDGGSPLVPCSQDPVFTILENGYLCGNCESELFFALACIDGHLACPTSYVSRDGTVRIVPAGQYVVLRDDVLKKTGQCAYRAATTYPGFALDKPFLLETVRDPTQPLVLMAASSSPDVRPTFDWLVADRTKGESAIRSLVTLTDMTKKVSVAYTIGDPVRNSSTGVDTLVLQPTATLAANTWYRVTISPGESQQFVSLHTYDRNKLAWLAAPETTDLYTYSRPMVATLALVTKSGGKGYLDLSFTEQVTANLGDPMATLAVDGVSLGNVRVGDLHLDLDPVPDAFTEITLRLPLTTTSPNGGTIRDGTVGNPHAIVDGDWAVYTFKASAMVLTDSGFVRRWYHAGM